MKNKSKTIAALSIFFVVVLTIYIVLISLILSFVHKGALKTTFIILSSSLITAIFVCIISCIFVVRKRRLNIRKSFDYYVEKLMSISGVGMIIYDASGVIYWTSSFVEAKFPNSLIGKNIFNISDIFSRSFKEGKEEFVFEYSGVVLEAKVFSIEKTIILKDVTNEDTLRKQYLSEKIVIGELEIDAFAQFQTILSEEDLFKAQTEVIKMLDSLVEKYSIVYRQYVNGKFIIISNKAALDDWVVNEFNFLDQIRKQKLSETNQLTASIGIGFGSDKQRELMDLAKEGLAQAQARGGDQVALIKTNEKPLYFGSKFEIAKSTSRVKIKQVALSFESALRNPATKNVIIYGHQFADLDALGATFGVYEIAKAFNKEVYIQNVTFDETTKQTRNETLNSDEIMKIFIKNTKAIRLTNKDTIVVICDTAEISRIENEKAIAGIEPKNFFIFDHHRVSELPSIALSQNIYVDTSASSASEIVTEIARFFVMPIKFSRKASQLLLNGIYLDTKQFLSGATTRTFEAASFLENLGASPRDASEILKIPAEFADVISTILKNVIEVKEGYFVSAYEGEAPQSVISKAADEILRTQGRKAAFVIAKVPGKKMFKMSARSFDVNVQLIAEAVGGGGHFGSAAAISEESLPIFKDNLIQAIISRRGD